MASTSSAISTFKFERDFAGDLRCIPMAMRLKLDLCGVKLTLRQWSRLGTANRERLMRWSSAKKAEADALRAELTAVIQRRMGETAQQIARDPRAAWLDKDRVPVPVRAKARALNVPCPTAGQWRALTELQRFALVKLSRDDREGANFVPALHEFGIIETAAQLV